jgi:hypothetical protein
MGGVHASLHHVAIAVVIIGIVVRIAVVLNAVSGQTRAAVQYVANPLPAPLHRSHHP